jgi:hypothetical protein
MGTGTGSMGLLGWGDEFVELDSEGRFEWWNIE